MHKELKERELENPDHYKRPKEYQNAASFAIENKLDIKSGQIQCVKMKIAGNPSSYSYGISF